MHLLQPRALYRRHKLTLVTSSLACERFTAEVPRSAAQVRSPQMCCSVRTLTFSEITSGLAGVGVSEQPYANHVPPCMHRDVASKLEEGRAMR